MVGCLALFWRYVQRAAGGTQKIFSALYSSGSSGLAPAYSPSPASSFAWCSSKLSEMYLRKMRPRTTCLYSAASMFERSLSAAIQSLASKPMFAELFVDGLLDLERAIREGEKLAAILFSGEGKKCAALRS